jgi:hypothetical protein
VAKIQIQGKRTETATALVLVKPNTSRASKHFGFYDFDNKHLIAVLFKISHTQSN